MPGQPVHLRVELRVGHLHIPVDHSGPVAVGLCRRDQQRIDRRVRRYLQRGSGRDLLDHRSIRGAHGVQSRDLCVCPRSECLENTGEDVQDPAGGIGVHAGGVVGQLDRQFGGGNDAQRERIVRRIAPLP